MQADSDDDDDDEMPPAKPPPSARPPPTPRPDTVATRGETAIEVTPAAAEGEALEQAAVAPTPAMEEVPETAMADAATDALEGEEVAAQDAEVGVTTTTAAEDDADTAGATAAEDGANAIGNTTAGAAPREAAWASEQDSAMADDGAPVADGEAVADGAAVADEQGEHATTEEAQPAVGKDMSADRPRPEGAVSGRAAAATGGGARLVNLSEGRFMGWVRKRSKKDSSKTYLRRCASCFCPLECPASPAQARATHTHATTDCEGPSQATAAGIGWPLLRTSLTVAQQQTCAFWCVLRVRHCGTAFSPGGSHKIWESQAIKEVARPD